MFNFRAIVGPLQFPGARHFVVQTVNFLFYVYKYVLHTLANIPEKVYEISGQSENVEFLGHD